MRASLVLLLALLAGACRSTRAADRAELVTLGFEGHSSLSVAELRTIALEELFYGGEERPTKASVDDAAYALELALRARGHREARVEYVHEDDGSGPVRAHFVLHEGPRTVVARLAFEGNASIPSAELAPFFGEAAEGGPLVESQLRDGLAKARGYYLDHGFREARCELAPFQVEGEGLTLRARIVVRVQEGVRQVLREVRFGVPDEELPVPRAQLVEGLIERPYTPRVSFRLRSRLLEAYARSARPRARVETASTVDPETGAVTVEFTVEPGEAVVVSEVRIEGNERTRTSVIRSLIPLSAGEAYDAEAVSKGTRELYATGLFESVHVQLTDEDALDVNVLEGPSLELRAEPGWGSYEGPRVVLALDENNLAGSARRLNLSSHLSALARGARLSLFDPRTFGHGVRASTSFFVEEREEPSFENRSAGYDLVFRRGFGPRVVGSVGYEFRVNELLDVDAQIADPEALIDPDVGLVATGVVYDDRDDVLLPTSGQRLRAQLEFAARGLGSEVDFLRGRLDYGRLFGLGPATVLGFSARAVWIRPLGATNVIPIAERAFNGGENSVRSFKEDELGPVGVGGEPVGGEASNVLSVELRRSLGGNFGGALFFDAGNVTPELEDYFDFDEFRFALGVGLRYSLPIGPLRLDLGFNPAAREEEEDFVLHFSVGYPF